MPERMNTERFRLKLKEVHGDAYNFDESEFNGWKEKVKIKCPVHGVLWINAYTLSKGGGCRSCNLKKTWKSGRKGGSRTWTKDEVETRLKELHGEDIIFSGISDSPKLGDKVNAICSIHGEFKRKPTLTRLLIEKTGCFRCRSSETQIKKNNRDYISDFKKVHGDKYDYSQFEFKGVPRHITVICPTHGPFSILIHNHLKGRGCRDCKSVKLAEERRSKPEDIIRRFNLIHNKKYTYERMNWVNYKTEITITCPKHGDFTQDPRNHIGGKGCPDCKFEKLS